jgi:small redox-active disulfide protein 2
MKTVQVYGTGCAKCTELEQRSRQAVEELGIDCEIAKVTDLSEIARAGVLMTPALSIDGEVRTAGKLLSVDEIKDLLR